MLALMVDELASQSQAVLSWISDKTELAMKIPNLAVSLLGLPVTCE